MTLNSFGFIIYLIALLFMMFVLQVIRNRTGKPVLGRVQLAVLLAFSFFFVYKTDWKFCICVLLIAVYTYLLGLRIEQTDAKKQKVYLGVGISGLVVFLGYFKYTNFFISSFAEIFGKDFIALNIMLPIGISFYTFSAIAYLLDVYWKRYDAERDFVNFALYISFFPKLTSGPIVRGREFFPQVRNYVGLNWTNLSAGIQIFVFGLFKKIVLADRLSVFVDDVYFSPAAYNTGTVILAVISYSLQIYFDFSGYSDMAIGISKILGFDFSKNFNLPYLSKNVSEFWKRWHISLSSWFQEYLYIPLGGSRKSNTRTYINLLLVMLISGLWHGVGVTFIVWGLLHGCASCIHRLWRTSKKKKCGTLWNLVSAVLTYVTVALLWIPFRAESFEKAMLILKQMFNVHSGISQPYTWSFFAILVLAVASIVTFVRARRRGESEVNGFYPVMDLTKIPSLVVFFVFVGMTVILAYFGNNAFIYGGF